MIDFDGSAGAGFNFAKKHRRILIVIADHRTGGFAVHDGSMKTKQVSSTDFTTTCHTRDSR